MSFSNIDEYLIPDYGIEDETLDVFILNEKCKDITSDYSTQIDNISKALKSSSKFRIIQFNEKSGYDTFSKRIFYNQFILKDRYIFYFSFLSNRDSGVIFINENQLVRLREYPHILLHEIAHHYEITEGNMPQYRPINETYLSKAPPFARSMSIGEKVKAWYVDGTPLPQDQGDVPYLDSIERFSDICVEKILATHMLSNDFYNFALWAISYKDPAAKIKDPNLQKYIRRMSLRDSADVTACIKIHDPRKDISKLINKEKKNLCDINQKYLSKNKIRRMFDEIHELTLQTPLEDFNEPEKFSDAMNEVFKILRIKYTTN